MPRGRPTSENTLAALKILWENKNAIGPFLFTFEASRFLDNSGIYNKISSEVNGDSAHAIRRLEKKGFFQVCNGGGRGRGKRLDVKWTDAGINYFSDPKSTKAKPAKVPTALPKPERLGAIFVDWDNLVIPAKMDKSFDSSEINIHLMRALFEASLKFVDRAHLFVFTSEGNLERNSFFLEVDAEDLEIELITVPTVKDAADEAIRKKAEEFAINNPEIPTFIFMSGDGYFVGAIAKLIESFGKKVVLMPYSKYSMNNIYSKINDISNKFSIVFLRPYFCKIKG